MPIRMILGAYAIIDFVALILFASSFGAIATLALVIGSGICGIQLMRQSGRQALKSMQADLMEGQQSLNGIMRSSAFLLGGILLVLPGPISDALGLLLVLPTLLRRYRRTPTRGGNIYDGQSTVQRPPEGYTLEGDYIQRKDPEDKSP